MKRALFVNGGWPGHQPEAFSALYSHALAQHGFDCRQESSLDCLTALDLTTFDLIVPNWTMGEITEAQSRALRTAIHGGVNLGGFHGGLGDAFRGDVEFKWMVGGMFVGHPHVGDYEVTITDPDHIITQGIPESFQYTSEQYYLLIDPGVNVLADTLYVYEDQSIPMPVVWTKTWGAGRVFYTALGHDPQEFEDCPSAFDLTIRGLRWAAGDLT